MIPGKTSTIEQRRFLSGYQKFEIRSDGDLEVTFKRFSVHNQFRIPLWQINPNPTRLKFIQTGSMAGMIIFGVFTLSVIIGMIASKDWGIAIPLMFPLFLFGVLAWTCFWKFKTQSVNANVYYYRHSDGQIHVWFQIPDAKSFEFFCETLTKSAEQAWANRPVDSTQSLAGEISALKKLVDSGVLSDEEFQKFKEKLINSTEDRKIGFQ